MWRKTLLIAAIVAGIFLQNILALKGEEPDYVNKNSKNPYSKRLENKPSRNSRETNNSNNSTRQVKPTKQFPKNVLIGRASSVSPIVEQLTGAFESKRLFTKGRSNFQTAESQIVQQVHQLPDDINQVPLAPLPQHYQCDSVIHDERFQIESPFYPSSYPVARQCRYFVAKNRPDVCQLEVSIQDMDIEDTPGCTGDYLDLGGTPDQRLCGLMMRGTKRYILFPSNNTQYAQITFNSDRDNRTPHRGFSAEIVQIPNSCYYPQNTVYGPGTPQLVLNTIYGQRINPPRYPVWNPVPPYADVNGTYPPAIYPQQTPFSGPPQYPPYLSPNGTVYYPPPVNYPQIPQTQYPLNGTIYPPYQPLPPFYSRNSTLGPYPGPPYELARPPFLDPQMPIQPFNATYPGYPGPYPTNYPPTYPTPYNGTFVPQLPLSPNSAPYDPRFPTFVNGSPVYPGPFPGQRPMIPYPNAFNKTPVYLASYCDIYLGELNGELRSPGYPFGYPTNHTCIYTIKRLTPDVCQVELLFHHLDIQTVDKKKDLTDQCEGDFLELPDRTRMCGYYNQAMSKDTIFKKYFNFADGSDYLLMQFQSDNQQVPDGGGFWIEVRQIPHTCTGNQAPNVRAVNTCDKIISGSQGLVQRVYSPNYPQFYPPNSQCFFLIKPYDLTTCEFELDFLNFELEAPLSTSSTGKDDCRTDFLELPDRTRICGHANYRRIFTFPKYHDRTAMLYFSANDHIQNRGFEVQIRQIPNSCRNGTFDARNPNQNVYEPTAVDPNIPLNPTPVFSFSNTSGYNPLNNHGYQPPLPTVGPRPNYPPNQQPPPPPIFVNQPGTKWGLKRSDIGPTYSVVADPRNVDQSGTVPLYYSNGSLATRLPPLRPVDMINFLGGARKGSKFTSSIISPKPMDKLREVEFAPRGFDNNIIEPVMSSSMLELQPNYGCDQTLSRPVEYIRSPNFPSNYPPTSRCIYTIMKTDNTVCQVRLQILSLDLEYTPGCKNDYVQIQSTNEKLCGRASSPETRLLNYFGHSRDIRLIFNSDRHNTGSGFEIRVEQVLNSCTDLSPISNRSAFSGRSGDLPTFHDAPRLSTAMAQAMPLINGINSNKSAAMMAVSSNGKVCRTIAGIETILESENYPKKYPSNMNCLYKIFRANADVCRLEIEFINYEVGNSDKIIGSNGACPNDFLEIDGIRYCGQQTGQRVAINFPRSRPDVSFRFVSVAPGPFPGFRLRIRQVDQNCGSRNRPVDDIFDDFSPPTVETCSRESEQNVINEKVVKIQSPKFGLDTRGYDPFLECDYTIQKYSFDVCALEIKFENFAIEESRACQKDYFEIGNQRLCGKMVPNMIKTYDFFSNKIRIRFHSDGDRNESGFAMIIKQIRC